MPEQYSSENYYDPDEKALLLCCSCKSWLRQPLLLRCLHNICSQCADERFTKDGERSLICPSCTRVTNHCTKQENLFIAARVDIEKVSDGPIECSPCRRKEIYGKHAYIWCFDCERGSGLCMDCWLEHLKCCETEHATKKIENFSSLDEMSFASTGKCRHHQEYPIDRYCYDCRIPVCKECAKGCFGDQHNVKDLFTKENQYDEKIADRFKIVHNAIHEFHKVCLKQKEIVQSCIRLEDDLKQAEERDALSLLLGKIRVFEMAEKAYQMAVEKSKKNYTILNEKASQFKREAELLYQRMQQAELYINYLEKYGREIDRLYQEKPLLLGTKSLVDELEKCIPPPKPGDLCFIRRSEPKEIKQMMRQWIGRPTLVPDNQVSGDELKENDMEIGKMSSAVKPGTIPEVDRSADVQPLKLSPSAMLSLRSLQKDLGRFGYYVCTTGLVIHTEDEEAKRNCDMIRTEAGRIVKGCNEDAKFEVVVSTSSFCAFFCGNNIGASIDINNQPQTIGMYLKDTNLLYGVTVAHNLVRDGRWNSDQFHHYEESSHHDPRMYDSDQPAIFGGRPSGPTFAACFSNKAMSTNGRPMLHFIDIMIAPALSDAIQVENGNPTFAITLDNLWNRCSTCLDDSCIEADHLRGTNRFSMCTPQHFDVMVGCDSEYYLLKDPNHMRLVCHCNNRNVLFGAIVGVQGSATVRFSEEHGKVRAENLLLIEPRRGSETPREGDSGSVWADETSKEIVAITIGHGSMLVDTRCRKDVWLATLLYPCFDVFKKVYGATLDDAEVILPLEIQP